LHRIESVEYSPDGKTPATTDTVKVWHVQRGAEILSFGGEVVKKVPYTVTKMVDKERQVKSPDGQVTTEIVQVPVSETVYEEVRYTLGNFAGSLAFSPDGRRFALASGPAPESECGTAAPASHPALEALAAPVPLPMLAPSAPAPMPAPPPPRPAEALPAPSAPSQRVLDGVEDMMWNQGAAFSPDGTRMACFRGQQPTVSVWEVATGKEVLTLRGHVRAVATVAYSPDGKWIASGGEPGPATSPGELIVWNAVTGEKLGRARCSHRSCGR
jgi:WD40 repeat protein